MSRELLRQALAVLENNSDWDTRMAVANAIRATLASPEQPASEDKPVAWIEVGNSHSGPYTFHGIEYLPEGRHNLYTHPAPANQDARDAARYRWLRGDGKKMAVDSFNGHYRVVDVSIDCVVTEWHDSFDAAIDAARGEEITRDELKRIAAQCGGGDFPGWPNTVFLERFAAAIRDQALEEAAMSFEASKDNYALYVSTVTARIRALKGEKP